MTTVRRVGVLLCCLLAISLVGAVAPGGAAPPPRPLCDACGDSFAATAEAHGVSLAVERSTATVTVHENGSATWVVANRLAEPDAGDAARLRANASLRDEIADRAMWDVEFLGANVSDDGVVTLRYRDPEFAEPAAGGALRSGEFTAAYGYRNLDGLGADRLTVVAPDGMRIDRTVPGASVDDDGARMTLTELDREGFVTFVPRESHLGPLWSLLAVAALVGPTFVVNALLQIALPAALFGLLVGALGGALSWLDGSSGDGLDRPFESVRDRAGVGLAVVGVLVTTLALLGAGGASLLGGSAAPTFGAGVAFVVGGLALSRPFVRESASYRRLVVAAALGVVVAAGATLGATLAFGEGGVTRASLTVLPFLIPLFALFPAGYALGRGRRGLAVGTAAGGFALGILPLASPFTPSALGLLFVPLLAAMYAAAIAVVGTPMFVVGASLAGARSRDGAGEGSPL